MRSIVRQISEHSTTTPRRSMSRVCMLGVTGFLMVAACSADDSPTTTNGSSAATVTPPTVAVEETSVDSEVPTSQNVSWSRDTLLAMRNCSTALQLLVLDGYDEMLVDNAIGDCDPAADQVAVDAELIGTYEASQVSLAVAAIMVDLSFASLDPSTADGIEVAAQRTIDAWENRP